MSGWVVCVWGGRGGGYLLTPLNVCFGTGDSERDECDFRGSSAAASAAHPFSSAAAAEASVSPSASVVATESVDVERPMLVVRSECGTAPALLQLTQTAGGPKVGWAIR